MGVLRERGFSLFELAVVVAVLAGVGLVAAVSLRPASDVALQAAAEQVAEALRLARSQAMLHGEYRGFRVLPLTTEIEVFEINPVAPTTAVESSVLDPVSKRALRYSLQTLPGCARIEISNSPSPFSYEVLGDRKLVVFDAQGLPHYLQSGTRYAGIGGSVVLSLDGETRSITLSPIGRVEIP